LQAGRPVRVGACAETTYRSLLGQAEPRDADTGGVRLLARAARGFPPAATIADGGSGRRAGPRLALPGIPGRRAVWHALHELGPRVTDRGHRAYDAITARSKPEPPPPH